MYTDINIQCRIVLYYQKKRYICNAYSWFDEAWDMWITPYDQDGGVRSCEHDYAALLPSSVTKGKEFGCDQKEIEVLDYWWENIKTGEIVQGLYSLYNFGPSK